MNYSSENQQLLRLIQCCMNVSTAGFKLVSTRTDATRLLLRNLIQPLEQELQNITLTLRPPSAPAVSSPARAAASPRSQVRWSPQTPPQQPRVASTPHSRYQPRALYQPESSAESYYEDESSDYLQEGSKYYEAAQAEDQFHRRYGRHETMQDLPMNRRMGKPFDRNAYTMIQTSTTVSPGGERTRLTRTTSGPDLSVLTSTNTDMTDPMSSSGIDTSFYTDAEDEAQ